jgi:hypothetical protein
MVTWDKVKMALSVAYAPVEIALKEEWEKNKSAWNKSWKPINPQTPYHIQFLLCCLFMVSLPAYFITQQWQNRGEFRKAL